MNNIGFVMEDSVLFKTDMYKNIKYGKLTSKDDEVKEIVDKVSILSENTEISQMSGGERQKIALARALIRDPKIILLDEFTISLDSSTEEKIKQSLPVILGNKTVLMVAHK